LGEVMMKEITQQEVKIMGQELVAPAFEPEVLAFCCEH
jgi:hypothetical protein